MFNFFKSQKSGIGLDISDRSIKLLSFEKKSNGGIEVESFGYSAIGEGVVENGNILDQDKLVEAISRAIREASPKSPQGKKVFLAIPDSRVFIDTYEINSSLSEKERVKTIKDMAAKTVPFEPNSLCFDFKLLREQEKKAIDEYLYVSSPKEVIDLYKETLEKAGLEPTVFEVESSSLARAFMKKQESSVLIFDMGARTTNLSIARNGEIISSTIIDFGGDQLTKIVSQNLKLSFEEADRLKLSMGIEGSVKDNKIKPLIESFCPAIIDEMIKQIDYYTKDTGEKIKEIVACGGSSLMAGIDKCLEDKLGKKVKRINPWKTNAIVTNFVSDKMFNKEAPILFATVIGLALRSLDTNPRDVGINLLKFRGAQLP
jgi:type IV pilus assembly protein PilM